MTWPGSSKPTILRRAQLAQVSVRGETVILLRVLRRSVSRCDQLLQSIEVTFVTSDLIWSQRCAIPFLQMQSMHMNAPATREFSKSMFWRLKVQNSKQFKYHCFSRSIALRFAAGKQMGRFQLPNEAARKFGQPDQEQAEQLV